MSAEPTIFQIALTHGIWRVTRDGAFFGDYRSRGDAAEGAEAAAQHLRKRGRAARIVTSLAADDAAKPTPK